MYYSAADVICGEWLRGDVHFKPVVKFYARRASAGGRRDPRYPRYPRDPLREHIYYLINATDIHSNNAATT